MNSTRARNGRWDAGWCCGVLLTTLSGGSEPWAAALAASPVTQAWAAPIRGPTNAYFQAAALALGPAGDAFVAGQAVSPGSDYDIVLSRHSPAGAMVWQKRFVAGDGSATDEFAAALVAQGTNLYLAGTILNPRGDHDFLTLKYRDTGDLEWAVRHDGSGGGLDLPVAVAVDAQGHVLVAGDSIGANGSYDFLVLKYDPTGHLLWMYRYDGPAQYTDRLAAMRLDAGGQIHLAGTSDEAEGKPGIVTLKLDPEGRVLWIARESSGHVYGATARALDLDAAGNVATIGTERSYCVTWKYDANGQRQWAARYRAEEPASMLAGFVRFDATGHILTAANLYGSGTNDTVLVKYAPDGEQRWAARIADPNGVVHLHALEVDPEGNAYVTATPVADALTVKVGSDGAQLWSTNYNSEGFYSDFGQFLKVDATGNVFVAGRSIYFSDSYAFLVKYTQQAVPGMPLATVTPALHVVEPGTNVVFLAHATGMAPIHYQWRKNGRSLADATNATLVLTDVEPVHRGDYSVVVSNPAGTTVSPEARLTVRTPPAVSIEPTDTLGYLGTDTAFIATVSGDDFVTLQWRHNGRDIPGATSEILRLDHLTAESGGAYDVTAITVGGSTTSSAAGLRISRAVELVGSTTHRGRLAGWENPPRLQILAHGDAVIVTCTNHPTRGTGLLVRKQNAAGALLWSAAHDSAAFTNAEPTGLGLDAAGNIYVTGVSKQPYLAASLGVLKYSPDGALAWFRLLDDTNQAGILCALAVAADGHSTIGTLGLHGTTFICYSSSGEVQWSMHDPSTDTDTIAVAVDASGNSYLGTTIRVGDGSEVRLRKINSTGDTVWTRPFAEGMNSRLEQLAVDPSGNLIAAGTGDVEENSEGRMFVLKYSPSGERLWLTRTGGYWPDLSHVPAMAVGAEGEIAVVTQSDDDATPEHIALIRITSSGQVRHRLMETNLLVAGAAPLAVDRWGNAYLTGYSGRPGTGADVATAKIDPRGLRSWLVYHSAPGLSWDYGVAVGADAAGDIRVLASVGSPPDSSLDLRLLHYTQADPAGTFRVELIRDAAGTFHLSAPVGQTFGIEASTDLREWTALGPEEEARLRQPGGTAFSENPQRFFRLIERLSSR